MPKNYDKKVILFPAGASGNFLAVFLAIGDINVVPNVRIDIGQRVPTSIVVSGGHSPDFRFNDFNSDLCLKNIKHAISTTRYQVILSHYQEVSKLTEFSNTTWIKKIIPEKNIFGWIKNIVYKKNYVEQMDLRHTAIRQQVDENFMSIQTWYEINRLDTDRPDNMIISFDKLYDTNYLKTLYRSANGIDPDELRIKFAEDYINKQFAPLEDCNFTSMAEILEHVKPVDPFDIATALFIYENNHNTLDTNRLWSIDHLPNTVPECIEFLIANEKKYAFFNE